MCGVCGCGQADDHDHDHDHDHPHVHEHVHVHADGRSHSHSHAHGPRGLGALSSRGVMASLGAPRIVQVERDLMEKNGRFAAVNRARFAASETLVLNLMSSPGSGKTSVLVRTLLELKGSPVAVIEGDQQTSNDADRVRATGAPALQVNTGKVCHLDASMIAESLAVLEAPKRGVLFVENVGNLVCPAGFDLGETKRVVVVSVTEGEDKPLKYPDMFAVADLVLVNKVDLLPYLQFDVALLVANARKVRPGVEVLQLSATTGQGFDAWLAWLRAEQQKVLRTE